MQKLSGALLILLSLALFAAGAASIIALIRALTVESTLAAIESAFGTLVIAVLLFVLARIALKAGMVRLGQKN